MKGDTACICLLVCSLPLVAAGQLQPFFFNNGVRISSSAPKPELMPEPRADVLEFMDGSSLHGTLAGMDAQKGLTWTTPVVGQPIHFRPAHIDAVRFARTQAMSLKPSCHLLFGNGDDLYGSISSLDDQRLSFSTWFGGAMTIPRQAVRAITLLSTNYSVVYDGPYDDGGWLVANNGWTFHDGAFVGSGAGTLGRDVNLTRSSTVEFDVAWADFFALEVGIYCDMKDALTFKTGSCMVNLTPRQISLRQTAGFNPTMLSAAVPGGDAKSPMHVAIECDKSEKTVSVFVNHVLAKTWKDCRFGGGGTGVLFMQEIYQQNLVLQNMVVSGSGAVKLSRLKISQWEDRCEPQTAVAATNADAVHFVNHDRASGKIESIQDGQVKLNLAGTVLNVPLDRVTQMEFAGAKASSEPAGPWEVRAHFPCAGSLSFQLEKWDDKVVSGQSAIFGSLAFQPGAIRELDFNLDRPKGQGVVAKAREFEDLDE